MAIVFKCYLCGAEYMIEEDPSMADPDEPDIYEYNRICDDCEEKELLEIYGDDEDWLKQTGRA